MLPKAASNKGYETCEPPAPDFSDVMFKLHKKSSKTGNVLQRFFILDDENI
jgi:hypothetical protein